MHRAPLEQARLGTTRAALLRTARRHHRVRAAEQESAVDAVLRACEPQPDGAAPRRLVLVRTTPASRPLAERVARELARLGHRALVGSAEALARAPDGEVPGLVVDVADHLVAPHRHRPLLADDLPHFAIVRETGAHLVGPFVLPGETPCLRCDELHRIDAERAWAVVAPQLLRLPAPAGDESLEWRTALHVGALVERLLRGLVLGEPAPAHPLVGGRLELARTGGVTSTPVPFHDGCGCRALPRSASGAPSSRPGARAAPTTTAALGARA